MQRQPGSPGEKASSSKAPPRGSGETHRGAAPSRAARHATPPPRPHTYSARGSAPPASRLHSSSRSLSAAEAVSPPLLPLPFRRCRAPRLAMASVDLKKKGEECRIRHPTNAASAET